METGPVEYIVIGFPGNRFKGEIVPALAELIESGLIRILDLVFVKKGQDGMVEAIELSDLSRDEEAPFSSLKYEVRGLFNEEDLQLIGKDLPNNSSAGLLVWENLWASRFAKAVRNADGQLIAYDRIPHEIAQAAIDFAAAEKM